MTARTDDYDAIVRVMRLYIDAFNENDVRKLKQAFDDDAWIFYIDADGSQRWPRFFGQGYKWISGRA